MKQGDKLFAPDARVVIRDAEWLIRRVDRTSTGGQALNVIGISEIVRDKEAVFLTEIDTEIQVLDPAETRLVRDDSPSYRASLLCMESLLRRKPPTDDRLCVAHKAVMDLVPYQLDPALQALRQPRQRILIADAVGLGKTLEAGILMSELIRRGKGKRILVLAVKSMLTQFQKEMWSRFTIPLVRLDSVGIQRIRSRIPTSHNPFHYYDKAIISIDTLKQDAEYRTYIENAYWDIIVIDEAHNVAERGHGSSMRARLARLLSGRSDTLIMLSATPHDGKARSFASLMNMLDPTAIADPEAYGPEDIRGLFIRRFKKDIVHQVEKAFKERVINEVHFNASEAEETAFDMLTRLTFKGIDRNQHGSRLFRITLEKALFSSPAACLETIGNRVRRMEKSGDSRFDDDIQALNRLSRCVEEIRTGNYTKYIQLLEVIRDKKKGFGWTGRDRTDRLVIFTERIATLKFLHKHLLKDLKLKEKQVEILHGGLSDMDQQRIVEAFGKEDAPVRLLIASDVASEGINLHYLSHRMIHFDIPWSLMVFQQRNGRIDRYGQERTPRIVYLITQSRNEKIRGDMRILELLIRKDEEAAKNIGDPAEFMGVYDINEEEDITAQAMASAQTPEVFEASLEPEVFDPLSLLLADDDPPAGEEAADAAREMPSLFPDDYTYLREALNHFRGAEPIEADFYDEEKRIDLTAPDDLRHRFRFLPGEMTPENGTFILSSDTETMTKEIRESRKEEKAWPRIHYLWPLNPVMEWVNDRVMAAFGRHEAPVLALDGRLQPEETVFLLSGLIPNRKGHPLIHRWFGVCFIKGAFNRIETFEAILEQTGLGKTPVPNRGNPFDPEPLREMLARAVEKGRAWMGRRRREFETEINEKLEAQLRALERLREKKYEQLELRFEGKVEKKDRERREIDRVFDEYFEWVEETMTTEDHSYIQVVAVLTGQGANHGD